LTAIFCQAAGTADLKFYSASSRVSRKVRNETERQLVIELEVKQKSMEQAESSTAAARKVLHANMNGASPDYELPWYVFITNS
jgi:hypothetical protein